MRRAWRGVIFLAVFLCSAGFDQGTKQWARSLPVEPASCAVPADLIAHRCAGVPQPVIHGVWDWELAMNDGAAFSSFRGSQIVLSLIALVALVVLGVACARTRPEQHVKRVALALVAGGALGNLIDRVRDGAVTDFVRWKAGGHLWPIFNVADALLAIGVGLLLIDGWVERRRARAAPA